MLDQFARQFVYKEAQSIHSETSITQKHLSHSKTSFAVDVANIVTVSIVGIDFYERQRVLRYGAQSVHDAHSPPA